MRMKRLYLVVVFVLTAVLLAGCGGGGKPSPNASTGIAGRLLNTDGSAVSGAVIRIGGKVTTSDADGRYTLTGVPGGTGRVWITADEHEPYFETITLTSGYIHQMPDLTLPATPEVNFYSVDVSSGTGSITMSDLIPSDRVKVIVSTRDKATPGLSTTAATANIALSALPGLQVREGVAARRVGLRGLELGSAEARRRQTERELAMLYGGPRMSRDMFAIPRMINLPIDDVKDFWLSTSDAPTSEDEWGQFPATLKYTSDTTYIYVDNRELDNENLTPEYLESLGDSFANNILPTTHGYFGTEDNPGVDNDPHIYILLTQLSGNTAGYFWGLNEYTDRQVADYGNSLTPKRVYHSNEKQMFYVDPDLDTDEAGAVLAHEFQHMIFHHQRGKVNDTEQPTWLNEALSEMSCEVNGYGLGAGNALILGHVDDYFRITGINSLVQWDEVDDPFYVGDYGAAYVFMRYVTDRFGLDKLKAIETSHLSGPASVAAAIGSWRTFDDLFTDWTLALALDHWGWIDEANRRFNFADDTLAKDYPSGYSLWGPWYYTSVPPTNSSGNVISFPTMQYGASFAHVKDMSGTVTWKFTPADPAVTDVVIVRHRY